MEQIMTDTIRSNDAAPVKAATNNEIYGHMLAWGVPAAYRREFDTRPEMPEPLRTAFRTVVGNANWYDDQSDALAAMVAARDVDAIRAWAAQHDTFAAIGAETSSADDREADGRDYADGVCEALTALADALEAYQPED